MKPTKPASQMSAAELAAYIDHSVLRPEFTPTQVRREVERGVQFGCRTVCVNPRDVFMAKGLCEGTSTGVCVVVDFPFGCASTESRVAQVQAVLAQGVDEVDVVLDFGAIRGGRQAEVEADLRAVIEPCHAQGVPVKVIFETDALTHEEIRAAADASIAAEADFIKTSTGFYAGTSLHPRPGASDDMVAFMIECAAGRCRVKGSGSIRDREHFLRLIDAGVDRVGIGSASVPVVLGIS